ncbi:MAG: hypothetical protein GQ546_08175 [Gammaproteobacteria bacterium]|nr:hypothetical protein [Gammaproteobacteria bacterium]
MVIIVSNFIFSMLKKYQINTFLYFVLFFNNIAYSGGAQSLSEAEQLFNTGAAYRYIVEEPNYTLACDYFEKSASKGFGPAFFNLAECYREGVGREINNELALKNFQTAYEKGVTEARLSFLALKLYHVEDKDACATILKEIEQFESEDEKYTYSTSFILGESYLSGRCGVSNPSKGIRFLEKSSEHNNLMAQALLYLVNKEGLYGVSKSLKTSSFWKSNFDNNPERNDWTLPFAIAGLYEKGWGVKKNFEISEKYKKEAGQQESTKDSK